MASKVRIELVSDGWRQLVQSDAIQKTCNAIGQSIANAAGDGFEYEASTVYYGVPRAGGFVNTRTHEAMQSEARYQSLSKAVHSV